MKHAPCESISIPLDNSSLHSLVLVSYQIFCKHSGVQGLGFSIFCSHMPKQMMSLVETFAGPLWHATKVCNQHQSRYRAKKSSKW